MLFILCLCACVCVICVDTGAEQVICFKMGDNWLRGQL